ncbi:unnamed protein product [Rotaria magnacalcarata]|uniref:Uncharacterized protein n=1 Tax=Rotaria magnacalcarata TaxID=392030 RepID=A0A819SKH8_9BILA|nr:unnamed protein product [Rotaria magnacalcarata]CAF4062896.1 unnamed protein product [Rotaria magnacalcarata]
MNGQYEFNRPGRGLPPYLLCQRDSESTIYSDGASRIFAMTEHEESGEQEQLIINHLVDLLQDLSIIDDYDIETEE